MALKTFRGKCCVQKVEPNSVASNAYMAGDNILDINGERVGDFEKFKTRFKHFMTTFKVCSTVVERPESPEALQATYAMLHLFPPTDSFPADAVAIAQREIARFLQNPNPESLLKSILVLPSRANLKACNENPFATDGSIYMDENTGELKPVKNQAGKLLHISHAKKPQEILIDSDVQNQNMLQKTKNRRLKGSTMMPPNRKSRTREKESLRGTLDSMRAAYSA
ncbi:hypothetical protein L596_012178 [Steinernema carpocapsae]|uniref:PDZ domain-containing protein n=1 Tax=Steinernema carpocapsae TaxID=34508 RepID=A0A4U5NWN0_STECR|nr:hypothetical protein L596_012178 [Steinernema carpocapsae]